MSSATPPACLAATPSDPTADEPGLTVAVPALARFMRADREIVAMLPVMDVNGELAAGAAPFAAGRAMDRICAGVMAADPFLVIDDLAAALRDAGFAAVTNFPTVQLVDGAAGAGLAAVGCDLAAELRILDAFRRRGFATHAYVTDEASAAAALRAGHESLVFHPAFRTAGEIDAAFAAVAALACGVGLFRHRPAA